MDRSLQKILAVAADDYAIQLDSFFIATLLQVRTRFAASTPSFVCPDEILQNVTNLLRGLRGKYDNRKIFILPQIQESFRKAFETLQA